jgi:PAS domain S-box-containing protein
MTTQPPVGRRFFSVRFLRLIVGVWVTALAALLIVATLTSLDRRQSELVDQTAAKLGVLRQARIDLIKGYLHVMAAGDPRSPFERTQGMVLLEQAASALDQALRLQQRASQPGESVAEKRAAEVAEFARALDRFRERLSNWRVPIGENPALETEIRSAFHVLERQADRIDDMIRDDLKREAQSHREVFSALLGGAVLLLSAIVMAVRRAERERALADQALRNREERLRQAVAVARLGLFDHDHRAGTIYWSPLEAEMHGLRGAEPTLQRLFEQTHPDDREAFVAAVRRAHDPQGDGVFSHEYRIVRPDGSVRWLNVRSQTAFGEVDGVVQPLRTIGAEVDVTDRKLAEAEIHSLNADLEQRVASRTTELQAALRELDSFAYAVSHDLRAPLRAMGGFSKALIEDHGDKLEGEARVFLDQIVHASKHMADLIDGLLTLSRSTRGDLRHDAIDLSALGESICQELAAAQPQRRVAWCVEPGMRCRGDARMIELVVRNLLDNAWKYSGKTPSAEICFVRELRAGTSYFCVSDNGVGFDMAHAARLFHPFQRLHRQDEFPGIGIGLATVQRIVRRHGGEIRAQAALGGGAKFCFSLPLIGPDAEPIP